MAPKRSRNKIDLDVTGCFALNGKLESRSRARTLDSHLKDSLVYNDGMAGARIATEDGVVDLAFLLSYSVVVHSLQSSIWVAPRGPGVSILVVPRGGHYRPRIVSQSGPPEGL